MSEQQTSSTQHNTRETTRTRELVEEIITQRLAVVSDQVNSINTASTNMEHLNRPPVFSSDSMDAHLWLLQYKDFTQSRNFNDRQFISSFASSLNQSAQKWFYNLQDDEKSDPATLSESFLKRFQPLVNSNMSSFFARQQKPQEPVENYIDEKVHLANQANIAEETAVWHTIENILPNTKQYVFDKVKDNTFKSVREHVKMAESVTKVTATTTVCHTCPCCKAKQDATPDIEVNQARVPHQTSYQAAPTNTAQTTDTSRINPTVPHTQPWQLRWQPQTQHLQAQNPPLLPRSTAPCSLCGSSSHKPALSPEWSVTQPMTLQVTTCDLLSGQ